MLRAIVAGILLVTVTSCTAWTPISTSPTSYIRMHDPAAVRLELRDGSTLVLGRPRVLGDTLRGIAAGVYRNIPLSSVVRFQAQEASKSKTAMLAAVAVVFAAGLVYVATHADHVSP